MEPCVAKAACGGFYRNGFPLVARAGSGMSLGHSDFSAHFTLGGKKALSLDFGSGWLVEKEASRLTSARDDGMV